MKVRINSLRITGVLLCVLSVSLAGCGGEEPLIGNFTSHVVQYDICRVVNGADRESCTEDERRQTLQLHLIEDEEQRVWLTGVPRGDNLTKRLLGTRDSEGGFLFVDRLQTRNSESDCRFTETFELSIRVDPEAAAETVGVDPCVALIGRETTTRRESAQCDTVNEEPEQVTRIVRKRWEQDVLCGRDTAE